MSGPDCRGAGGGGEVASLLRLGPSGSGAKAKDIVPVLGKRGRGACWLLRALRSQHVHDRLTRLPLPNSGSFCAES